MASLHNYVSLPGGNHVKLAEGKWNFVAGKFASSHDSRRVPKISQKDGSKGHILQKTIPIFAGKLT